MYHVEDAFWKNTKNSRKYSFSCHFFLLLLFGFFVVFSEHIKKMVNNVRGKDFHSHSLRLSSNVPVHFDVKRKNDCVPKTASQQSKTPANCSNVLSCSSIVDALMRSFLWIGPMLTPHTGILDCFRKTRRASKDPMVDAWTKTPLALNSAFSTVARSVWTSSYKMLGKNQSVRSSLHL